MILLDYFLASISIFIFLSGFFLLAKNKKKGILFYLLLIFTFLNLFLIVFLPSYGLNIDALFYLTIPAYVLIMTYILIKNKPISLIGFNDIAITVILTSLLSFIVFLDQEISFNIRLLFFILIYVLSFLISENIYYLSSKKTIFNQKKQEVNDKNLEIDKIKKSLESSSRSIEEKIKEKTRDLQSLNESLERLSKERKRDLEKKEEELEEKIKELENLSKIFMERENKMIELKNRIKELENNK